MKALRSLAVATLVLAMAFLTSIAQAQAIKQLPADALAIIKLNNPQSVSQKIAQISEKMGVAKIRPELADTLGWALKEAGIKEGFNPTGEVALGIYAPTGDSGDPRPLLLLPVTDYKAFMGNMKDVKTEGDLTSFKFPTEDEQLYSANWGNFAAISNDKDLVGKKPAGVNVVGASLKQLDSNDLVAWANVKLLAEKYLPDFRKARTEAVREVEQSLKNEAAFNQKFTPVIVALVDQFMNLCEGAMESAQGATLGFTLSKEGINTAFMIDFSPGSKAGQILAQCKNTGGDLLTGLPDRAYLAYGGAALDPKLMPKIIDDLLGPVPAELQKVGPDAKPFVDLIEALRNTYSAINGMAAAYAVPTGEPGKQSAIQEIVVLRGDSAKIAQSQRQTIDAVGQMLKMVPKQEAASMSFDVKQNAKTVDGAQLDQISMNFKFDENAPQAAQISQIMSMIYGGNSVSGYMGAADDKTYIVVVGNDELLAPTIAAARKRESAVSEAAPVKQVNARLPQQRACVYYIAVDNIVNTVVSYMNKNGLPISVKFPTGQPPIGVVLATEGSALFIESHVSSDLLQNIIAVAIQATMGGQKDDGGKL